MELLNARGTKDYLPQEMIVLNDIMSKLKAIFELYGYNPLTTPALERLDILSAKYAGGSEIMKEIFKLKDQGKRDLGLRYDLTVPFSRVVGQNPQLKFPFKRYQMEKVYRDGPIKAGRYREFWQCDVDVVGSVSMQADAEMLAIAERFFKAIDIDADIQVNNRRIINGILDTLGIVDKIPVILVIDKMEKQPREQLVKELNCDNAEQIITTFADFDSMTNDQRITKCEALITTEEGKKGIQEIKELMASCKQYGLQQVTFNPRLARGLAYYTSTVFEAFAKESKITSSICGGGRYDQMIGEFLESKQQYPAVGISFGLSTIYDVVTEKQQSQKKCVTKVFIISIKEDSYARTIAEQLRSAGIQTELDLMSRSLSKNMQYVNALSIPFAIIVGEDERKNNTVTLRDMGDGEQSVIAIDEVITRLQK